MNTQAFEDHQAFRSVPKTGVIYVMSRAQALGFSYQDPEWVNLGQGAPETGSIQPEEERLNHIKVDLANSEYSPVAGNKRLREQVAQLYNQRYRQGKSSQYTWENVAISAGGRSGLTRIAASLGSVNLGHILPDYTAYEELFEALGAFVPIPILTRSDTGFTLNSKILEDEIIARGLGAILLSNPCNPTGQVLAGDELQRTLAFSREVGCALIFDEFYSHYYYAGARDGKSISAAEFVEDVDKDGVILVDGLTKNWRYPGLRLSWTLGPKTVIERISSAGSFLDGGAAHPIQEAAIPLLDLEVAQAQAQSIQKHFGDKRDYMLSKLQSMGFEITSEPQGSFYCFASLKNLPEPLRDGMAFFETLLEHKVICVPGEFFDVNPGRRRSHIPSRLKSYIRFSFGPGKEELVKGLERIASVLEAHQ